MDRMARQTKQPAILREIFAVLGNDPAVIAECVARPALAERSVRNLYAHDQRFHGELKRRAEAELKTYPAFEQLKHTNATYTEVEWIKDDPKHSGSADIKHEAGLTMSKAEWDNSVARLESIFGNAAHSTTNDDAYQTIPTGRMSTLQEDDGSYYAIAVLSKTKDRLKIVTVAWMKLPLETERARAGVASPSVMRGELHAGYKLPVIASATQNCTDTWAPTSELTPDSRQQHTAVWTGSEMIVWGGYPYLNTGGKYDPATDSWTLTSTTNAPDGRYLHSAVWTGVVMVVWGGAGVGSNLNTGGRVQIQQPTVGHLLAAPMLRTHVPLTQQFGPVTKWSFGAVNRMIAPPIPPITQLHLAGIILAQTLGSPAPRQTRPRAVAILLRCGLATK